MKKEKDTVLEGILVKRRKVLLPKVGDSIGDIFWIGAGKLHLHQGILLERTTSTVKGYKLYGTDIPVVFCYPHWNEMVNPIPKSCIGVETRQWPISSHMVKCYPDGNFYYNGRVLADEEVLSWLENENNIESMRKVKDWALSYGEDIQKKQELAEVQVMTSTYSPSISERKETLLDRNKVLVAKYNS